MGIVLEGKKICLLSATPVASRRNADLKTVTQCPGDNVLRLFVLATLFAPQIYPVISICVPSSQQRSEGGITCSLKWHFIRVTQRVLQRTFADALRLTQLQALLAFQQNTGLRQMPGLEVIFNANQKVVTDSPIRSILLIVMEEAHITQPQKSRYLPL